MMFTVQEDHDPGRKHDCPICDVRDPARERVARHFGDELNEVVNALDDKQSCPHCNYSSDKVKNLGIHIALVHGQLDEYLANDNLIEMKRNKIQATFEKCCKLCTPKAPGAIGVRGAGLHVVRAAGLNSHWETAQK